MGGEIFQNGLVFGCAERDFLWFDVDLEGAFQKQGYIIEHESENETPDFVFEQEVVDFVAFESCFGLFYELFGLFIMSDQLLLLSVDFAFDTI